MPTAAPATATAPAAVLPKAVRGDGRQWVPVPQGWPQPRGAVAGGPGPATLLSSLLQMGFCTKKWRRVIPEAPAKEGKQILAPRRSRVNGWSKPLHSFQAAAWIMFLVLAFASFFIFIPLLPQEWKYIAYIVSFRWGTAARPACCLKWGGGS